MLGAATLLWLLGPRAALSGRRSDQTSYGLRFSYPRSWTPDYFPELAGTGDLVLASLGANTGPRDSPCPGNAYAPPGNPCGPYAVDHLFPHGVLVVWSLTPATTAPIESNTPGTPEIVGGRPATRQEAFPGVRGPAGGVETISVTVPDPNSQAQYRFTACLSGPDLARGRSEVNAVLASASFSAP